ncbi:MAG: DUF454 domain-containing protein [Alphaproteobacteria bacterium]|nr:DUF454 domain-containing protein [Alphaproteobacteria bacterium]
MKKRRRAPLGWYGYVALGWLCVGLGAAGAALPLMPTVPFLLVGAWAFSRSSPRFRRWLHAHARLGPPLRAWRRYGVIPLRAKLTAAAMMALSFSVLALTTELPVAGLVAVAAVLIGSLTFILSRPNCPPVAANPALNP